MKEYPDEVYPNQPLVEVIFEIKFPGEVRVECERHLFWEEIREDYPNVLVPQFQSDKAVALSPYKFRRADEAMTVSVAMNSLSLSAKIYPGYKEFSKEVLRIHKVFKNVFDIKKANRIGWRYINVMPFVRKKGVIPLSSYLNIGVNVPKSVPKEYKNIDLLFESEYQGRSLITHLQAIHRRVDSIDSEEALLLDIDYGRVSIDDEELLFDDVPKYLTDAHNHTRCLFEDLITDEYRQFLRGDVI